MNVDRILAAMNGRKVEYILIGGMNFALRHRPVVTFDVDLWVRNDDANLRRCEAALADLDAEWGPREDEWQAVSHLGAGWLSRQALYCLTSPHGAVDIFRALQGLASWDEARRDAVAGRTAGGTPFVGLADADMLRCQEALPPGEQHAERIAFLRRLVKP